MKLRQVSFFNAIYNIMPLSSMGEDSPYFPPAAPTKLDSSYDSAAQQELYIIVINHGTSSENMIATRRYEGKQTEQATGDLSNTTASDDLLTEPDTICF